jgi:hypothetical protein
VSKKLLSGIRLYPVEYKTSGQWPPQLSQAHQSALAPAVPADFEYLVAPNPDLNFIALFQTESFNESGGKANNKASAPFGDLHVVGGGDFDFEG